ncbi:hypothetical protein AALP_AA5G058500 [Arabis alpina]|uniref:Uncharacterized protein n=1 Tax=Arabis alpina TaxID=50452 RepID=A0A087GV73_ARAAL|nr:hypothetical protein AALP_AA5G058500 [Arabis alpina]
MALSTSPECVHVLDPPLPPKPPDPAPVSSQDPVIPVSPVVESSTVVVRLSVEELSADAPVPVVFQSTSSAPHSVTVAPVVASEISQPDSAPVDTVVVEPNPVVFGTALPWASRFRSYLRNLKKEVFRRY